MSITEKFRLLSPFSVDREIHGQKVTFYTCSVRTCAKLSGLLSQLASNFTTLLAGGAVDQGSTEEVYHQPDGELMTKKVIEPINPDLATMRGKQREKAVHGAIQALFDPKNRAAIGELLMDSLKDEFPRGQKRPVDECQEFVDQMDLPTFIEFLRGLAAANAKVFGDLGKELGRAVQDKAKELLGTGAEDPDEEEPNEEQPTDG